MNSTRYAAALALAATSYSLTVATARRADPCGAARTEKAAGPAAGAVTPAEVCRVLSVLADDSLEGRGTGTPGGAKAARYIAEEMRAIGLEPGGDSGYFQRVPIVISRRDLTGGRVQERPMPVASFAIRDTFPVNQRGIAVNVIGILRGSDPVLADSVVLVDAHYDHLGMRAAGPVDIDSVAAYAALAGPIEAEQARWLATSGLNARAVRGGGRGGASQVSDTARARLADFDARLRGLRVNMDSVRRAHPSAHLDSIYNGADDDASGTVAVLEIARQLAKTRHPKRTIVFAATTGEEVGLIGTQWYIAHPARPLTAMQANLEIEMIGRPDSLAGGAGRAWLTGYERSNMGQMFAAAGLPVVADKRPDQQFFQRSDNIAFARMGIPAHTLSTFNLHADYHQLTDEITTVDFAHMAGVINTAVKAVSILGNEKAPAWFPGGRPENPAPRRPVP